MTKAGGEIMDRIHVFYKSWTCPHFHYWTCGPGPRFSPGQWSPTCLCRAGACLPDGRDKNCGHGPQLLKTWTWSTILLHLNLFEKKNYVWVERNKFTSIIKCLSTKFKLQKKKTRDSWTRSTSLVFMTGSTTSSMWHVMWSMWQMLISGLTGTMKTVDRVYIFS